MKHMMRRFQIKYSLYTEHPVIKAADGESPLVPLRGASRWGARYWACQILYNGGRTILRPNQMNTVWVKANIFAPAFFDIPAVYKMLAAGREKYSDLCVSLVCCVATGFAFICKLFWWLFLHPTTSAPHKPWFPSYAHPPDPPISTPLGKQSLNIFSIAQYYLLPNFTHFRHLSQYLYTISARIDTTIASRLAEWCAMVISLYILYQGIKIPPYHNLLAVPIISSRGTAYTLTSIERAQDYTCLIPRSH